MGDAGASIVSAEHHGQRTVRHRATELNGCTVGAACLLTLVAPPRMLPHPLRVDILIGAAAWLTGYALTAAALLLVGRIVPQVKTFTRLARPLTVLLIGAAVIRTRLRTGRLGVPGLDPGLGHAALAVTGAVLLATTVRVLLAVLGRMPRRRILALAGLPPLLWVLLSARSDPHPVDWKGTEFLDGNPDAASISALTGRPALTPDRIYLPLDAADDADGRVEAALEATEHAGALGSRAILLIMPTGSGWVNPRIVRAVEEQYDGDVTSVAVQYAASPSWAVYLQGGAGVQETALRLVLAMRARIDQLPADRRPDLLVHGESLGAWGLVPALRAAQDAVDGALLTGVPGQASITGPGITVVNHPDDPVPDWNLWRDPVTFWRSTADAMASEAVPVGFGHRYGAEAVELWCEQRKLPVCKEKLITATARGATVTG